MIADVRARRTPLANTSFAADSELGSKVRWDVTCELMARAFFRASFYTSRSGCEALRENAEKEKLSSRGLRSRTLVDQVKVISP